MRSLTFSGLACNLKADSFFWQPVMSGEAKLARSKTTAAGDPAQGSDFCSSPSIGLLADGSAELFDRALHQCAGASPFTCAADAPEHAARLDLAEMRAGSLSDPLSKLLIVRQGNVALEGPHGRWSIVPDHMVFIPAQRPYMIAARPGTTVIAMHLRPEDVAWKHAGCWVAPVTRLATELANCALRWGADRPAEDATANAVFAAIGRLCPEWFTGKRILWTPFVASAELRRAVQFAREHLETASAETAADAACTSARTLRRRFQRELGLSWRDFMREIRMSHAMELLSSQGMSVTDTAMSVGFSSIGAFSAAFASYTGKSPSFFLRRRSQWTPHDADGRSAPGAMSG